MDPAGNQTRDLVITTVAECCKVQLGLILKRIPVDSFLPPKALHQVVAIYTEFSH